MDCDELLTESDSALKNNDGIVKTAFPCTGPEFAVNCIESFRKYGLMTSPGLFLMAWAKLVIQFTAN